MKTENVKKLPDGTFVKTVEIEGLPKERVEVILTDREGKKITDICDFFGAGKIVIRFIPKHP